MNFNTALVKVLVSTLSWGSSHNTVHHASIMHDAYHNVPEPTTVTKVKASNIHAHSARAIVLTHLGSAVLLSPDASGSQVAYEGRSLRASVQLVQCFLTLTTDEK